jgi:hypothetical protein
MAAKTVEEIKAEIVSLVKSQGNQGAISLGTVLDDITELAGEGGGGGSTPNVIRISSADGVDWTIDNPDDLEGLAEKAKDGEVVVVKSVANADPFMTEILPAYFSDAAGDAQFNTTRTFIAGNKVICSMAIISVSDKTLTVNTAQYPA